MAASNTLIRRLPGILPTSPSITQRAGMIKKRFDWLVASSLRDVMNNSNDELLSQVPRRGSGAGERLPTPQSRFRRRRCVDLRGAFSGRRVRSRIAHREPRGAREADRRDAGLGSGFGAEFDVCFFCWADHYGIYFVLAAPLTNLINDTIPAKTYAAYNWNKDDPCSKSLCA
ncbi:hypothetical protein BDV96DRAFT_593280 [Lophiotrema nucula]|uniref:Uncharacterized protein n=1 Tax=Lophiotrema nucula TaxID=690887 RepID=A0A6A5ZSU8_9PLEO|nr:hypothetical protein BDV96DRAFT_593280 [Lophiotrema nucula]